MLTFSIKLSKKDTKKLTIALKRTEQLGDLVKVKRIMTILMLCSKNSLDDVSSLLKISREAIRAWLKAFLLKGVGGLNSKKSSGRPSKLTKSQRAELVQLIQDGPEKSGFPGACWRTPMIQHLIEQKFDIFYSVKYLSEYLKSLGLSYQKAKFIAD
jgi:transposase